MLPYFTQHYGNASSKGHAFGWAAAEAVKLARESVAELMKAQTEEIYFTGGSTESLNTAIKGVATTYRNKGNHIVTVKTEHKGPFSDSPMHAKHYSVQVLKLPILM